MTPAEEDAEILRNARAARAAGEINDEQLHDVYYIVGRAQAERELK